MRRQQLQSAFLAILLCGSFTAAAQDFGSSTPNGPRKSTFANLSAVTDGAARYCTDCTATAPCAGSGTGAFAYRVGSAWNCNIGGPALATPVTVANGGTGNASVTAFAPLFGGTTSTGAFQSGTVGTSGQLLTSNGAGALPTFQPAPSSGIATTGATTGATSQVQPFTNGVTLGSVSVPGVLTTYSSDGTAVQINVSGGAGTILLDPLRTPTGSGNTVLDTGPTIGSPTINNPTLSGTTSAVAINASGLITPSSTVGLAGTTTNNNVQAGSLGEFITAKCPGPATTATITVTIATPAVVTWTAHPFSGTAPRFDACPVVFTTSSSLPTGITAGTNYWVVPSSISGNNFSIATSVANAIAGTKVATSGSQAGTQTGTAGTVLSTGAAKDITGFALTAGDWDCSGATDFQFGSTTSITNLVGSISTTSATLGGQDTGFDFETPAAIPTATADTTWPISNVRQLLSGTTNVFSVAQGTFTASTLKGYGTIRCRRMR